MPVPPVLLHPPWRQQKAGPAAPSAKKATQPSQTEPPRLVWQDGEREAFAGKEGPRLKGDAEEKAFERLLDELDKHRPLRTSEVARLGDEKLAELAQELGPTTCDATTMKLLLGRLGDAFVEQAVTIVRAAPRERVLFEAAQPIESGDLARTAAALVFDREIESTPYVATAAETWLLRHASVAMRALEAQEDAKAAHGGMAFLVAHGKGTHASLEAVASLAPLVQSNGWLAVLAARGMDHRIAALVESEPEAKTFLAHVRAADEEKKLGSVTFAVAPLPAFFDVAVLPRPKLVDGTPLPDEAVRVLGEMLRLSPLLHPYPGIAQVKAACEPASLDAFALALLDRWAAAGEDARDLWAFESCGKIGGEPCAREIASRIRGWARGSSPETGGHGYAYARAGCNVLAALAQHGADIARVLLDDLSRTAVQLWLRKEAQRLTGSENVTREEIEAQVPTFGLDASGSATFDVGSQVYRLGFDEGLTPYLVSEAGEHVTSFPRLRKEMDATKHAEAKKRFGEMTKDARTVARYQVALLDRTMCEQRAMAAKAFRERYVEHPLLRHLGRRVVWGTKRGAFRVADDGSLADASDALFTLSDGDEVTVVHPVTMKAEDRHTWASRFADYRIMQPFPQLGREIFVVTAVEIGERDLDRFVSAKVERGRLFQLGRRGWQMRHADGGSDFEHTLPCGALARFSVTPQAYDENTAVYTVTGASCSYALDRLPIIDYSELMRDLQYACAHVEVP